MSASPFTARPSSTVSTAETFPARWLFRISPALYAGPATSPCSFMAAARYPDSFSKNSHSSKGCSGVWGGKNTAKNWAICPAWAMRDRSTMVSGVSYRSPSPRTRHRSRVSQCMSI